MTTNNEMMRLKKGDAAIDFSFSDYQGNEIKLSDYKGYKVLLTFFRDAPCPFCNMRVQQLIRTYPEFEKRGIKVITLFGSSKEEIMEYAGKQNAPFPIIPDPELELYAKYHIEKSKMGMVKALMNPVRVIKVMTSGFFNMNSGTKVPVVPADFLIDEQQVIARAYYGKDYSDHIDIQEVLDWNLTE